MLEGVSREPAITRLVMSHVGKAEKARRHGRELSFILPHNAVDNFAPLFSAIEHEINTRANRLGISSYGVSMTTLEEVRNSSVKFADLAGLEMIHCLMRHTYFFQGILYFKNHMCFHGTSVCFPSFMTTRKVRPSLC